MRVLESRINMDHNISFRWLLRFAFPTIIATVFMNIYSVVDGIFVARLVSTDALSAVNIVSPLISIVSGIGMMFGSGGNALIARKIGEGKEKEAREDFSMLLLTAFVFSVSLAIIGFLFLSPICRVLGSDEALLGYCSEYMFPVLIAIPFTVFGSVFHMSFITVGKAGFGLMLSVLGGVLNIVLDWLFIAVFGMGLSGAAIATSIGYVASSLIGLVWFAIKRDQVLHLVRPKWRTSTLWKSCMNGSSEMVSVLAFSVVSILFNNILMRLAGSDGVAALTIILYTQGLFSALFRGYSMGISPVVSYNLGKQDKDRLSGLFSISMKTIGATTLVVVAASYLLGGSVVSIFSGNSPTVYDMSLHGFRIVAASYLMLGTNIFSSAWFTALNDGKTSAILSFCRTIVFLVLPVLILPRFFKLDGVWLSMAAGETMSLVMTVYYFLKHKNRWRLHTVLTPLSTDSQSRG